MFLGISPYEAGLSNTGRATYMLPVTWQNDWPVILKPGEAMPTVVKRPNLPVAEKATTPTTGSFSWRDDFDGRKPDLRWVFLRTPREPWWSLVAKPGSLLSGFSACSVFYQNHKHCRAN